MSLEQLYVKMALHAWESHIKRTDALFSSLTDEQLLQEVSPGRNRAIYLLGHLTAVHDSMCGILGLGERRYPQLDVIFLSSPDKAGPEMPPIKELRQYWSEANSRLADHFAKLPHPEWFQKHMSMSEEDFAKEPHRNKLSVLLNRTNHLAYHFGQLVLLKK